MTRFILTFTLLISSCALSPHVTFPAHSDSPSVPTQHQSSGSTVLQLAFSREAQLFDRETSVFGLRLGLLSSDNHRVHGIDFNLVKGISGGGSGIATSLGMNWVTQDFNGIQIAAIMNAMDGRRGKEQQGPRMSGLQIGLINFNENGFLPVFPFVKF